MSVPTRDNAKRKITLTSSFQVIILLFDKRLQSNNGQAVHLVQETAS